jgi:hypothetical protein
MNASDFLLNVATRVEFIKDKHHFGSFIFAVASKVKIF